MKVFNYVSQNMKLAQLLPLQASSPPTKLFLYTFPKYVFWGPFKAVDNIDTANGSIEAWREIFRRFEDNQANNFIDIGHWTLIKTQSLLLNLVFHAVLDTKYDFHIAINYQI